MTFTFTTSDGFTIEIPPAAEALTVEQVANAEDQGNSVRVAMNTICDVVERFQGKKAAEKVRKLSIGEFGKLNQAFIASMNVDAEDLGKS